MSKENMFVYDFNILDLEDEKFVDKLGNQVSRYEAILNYTRHIINMKYNFLLKSNERGIWYRIEKKYKEACKDGNGRVYLNSLEHGFIKNVFNAENVGPSAHETSLFEEILNMIENAPKQELEEPVEKKTK